jgi:hypothetical protein
MRDSINELYICSSNFTCIFCALAKHKFVLLKAICCEPRSKTDVCGVQCNGGPILLYKSIGPESVRTVDPSGQIGQEMMVREKKTI